MLIGKDFRVTAEKLDVVLSQRKKRTNKTTNETYEGWETLGYFRTVEGALHELLNQGVRDTELKDLRTVVVAVESLHDDIHNAFQSQHPSSFIPQSLYA